MNVRQRVYSRLACLLVTGFVPYKYCLLLNNGTKVSRSIFQVITTFLKNAALLGKAQLLPPCLSVLLSHDK